MVDDIQIGIARFFCGRSVAAIAHDENLTVAQIQEVLNDYPDHECPKGTCTCVEDEEN
jgi:hypothetical protein